MLLLPSFSISFTPLNVRLKDWKDINEYTHYWNSWFCFGKYSCHIIAARKMRHRLEQDGLLSLFSSGNYPSCTHCYWIIFSRLCMWYIHTQPYQAIAIARAQKSKSSSDGENIQFYNCCSSLQSSLIRTNNFISVFFSDMKSKYKLKTLFFASVWALLGTLHT